MHIAHILIACLCVGLPSIVGAFYVWLITDVKKEIGAQPRTPMFICPANPSHGVFPASGTFKITVPAEGMAPIQIEMCPFCYDEKMKASEKIFKK